MELILSEGTIMRFAQALCAQIDSGSGAGVLELYDTRTPTEKGGGLLARLQFAKPCAPEVSGTTVQFAKLKPEGSAPNVGKAIWAIAKNSAGEVAFECDVGERGDMGARGEKKNPVLVLDDSHVRKGDMVSVKEFSLWLRQTQAK